MGSLEGKVAVITGAANGLGKSHALELARQGASVVVNDLGTAKDGLGTDESAARAVVAEIEALGGRAVPHFGDCADLWRGPTTPLLVMVLIGILCIAIAHTVYYMALRHVKIVIAVTLLRLASSGLFASGLVWARCAMTWRTFSA